MVTIVGPAKRFHEARHGAGFKRMLSGGGRGMVGTTALLGASRLMPAPAWMTLMLVLVGYLVATKLYDKAEPKAEEVARIVRDWFGSQEWTNSCSDLARNMYPRGKAVVGNVADPELARDVANTVVSVVPYERWGDRERLVDGIPEHGQAGLRGGVAVEVGWRLIGCAGRASAHDEIDELRGQIFGSEVWSGGDSLDRQRSRSDTSPVPSRLSSCCATDSSGARFGAVKTAEPSANPPNRPPDPSRS